MVNWSGSDFVATMRFPLEPLWCELESTLGGWVSIMWKEENVSGGTWKCQAS